MNKKRNLLSQATCLQRALLFAGGLIMLLALLAIYLTGGTSNASTRIGYRLDLSDPASGIVDVTMTLQPGPQPFVDLYLREPVQDGRQRITNLRAERGGRALPTWQPVPGFADVLRVWNGFDQQPLTITYRVDPLWYKGPDSPRSYLGAAFGYLRGMVTLYTPISLRDLFARDFYNPSIDSGFAELEARLPSGWQMVSPFGSQKVNIGAAYLRNAYFGFGPFDVQDLLYGKTPFLLGVSKELAPERSAELAREVPAIFGAIQEMTGFTPVSHTCYFSLAIYPSEPIHGGASGTASLVVDDDIQTIAHEMFHWWNGDTLATSQDANWIKEGFTTYYSAKILYRAGIWDEAAFINQLERFEIKAYARGAVHPLNLKAAAQKLARDNDGSAYDTVYFGGALLAAWLDEQLTAQGSSLDAIWPRLAALERPATSEDFLAALEDLGGESLSAQARAILNGETTMSPLAALHGSGQ